MKGIRIVAPFRTFEVEAQHHVRLQAEGFDWPAAISMMVASAEQSCRCPVHVLTDPGSTLTVPTLRYDSPETRLMLWNLDVVASYLESDAFDRDTVVVDCDQLFYGDLAPWFSPDVDLGILVRPSKAMRIPILNGVQFLARRAGDRLAAFYRKALDVARALSEEQIKWGADTEALRILLEPLDPGVHRREGLTVALMDHRPILMPLTEYQIENLKQGQFSRPVQPVLDFRYMRKLWMKRVFELSFAGACA